MGKSVLIERFLKDLQDIDRGKHQQKKVVLLRGRCFQQETVPFKALDSLIDSLAEFIARLPQAETRKILPAEFAALKQIFPVLGNVNVEPAAPQILITKADQQELRQRTLDGLRTLLTRLGESYSLILYVDDLQWGDEDSGQMLADLLRPPNSPVLLLIGAYRTENVGDSKCLQAIDEHYRRGNPPPHRQELPVEPLSQTDNTHLAKTLFQASKRHDSATVEMIARASSGIPFFVHEMVQSVLSGAKATAFQTGQDFLDEVIWQRSCGLPSDVQALLAAVVVAGRPTSAEEICRVADQVEIGVQGLAALRSQQFIRSYETANDTLIEAYHDRIRESVYQHQPLDQRQILHERFATASEERSGVSVEDVQAHLDQCTAYSEPDQSFELKRSQWQRVFDIAYHFDAAGQHSRALPYALAAAEQSRQQYSLEAAETQYRIALRGAQDASMAIRFRVAEGLGDVLMLRGSYDETEQQFESALALAKGQARTVRTRIRGKLGELSFKRGDMQAATEALEGALKEMGAAPPRSGLGFLIRLTGQSIVQCLHSIFPRFFVGRRQFNDANDDLVLIRLYSSLSYPYWCAGGQIPCMWTQLCAMNMSERYPPTPERAKIYAEHAAAVSMIPYFKRGARYAEQSLKIRRDLGDLWGEGHALSFYTMPCYATCRYREALDYCTEAIGLLQQTGDPWQNLFARHERATCLFRLGDLKATALEAEQIYRDAVDLGDVQSSGIAFDVWAMATQGRVPKELIELESERPRFDVQAQAQVMHGAGMRLFLDEQFEEAAAVFAGALEQSFKAGVKNAYITPNIPWYIMSLRKQAEQSPSKQSELLRQALRVARQNRFLLFQFRSDQPHVQRELGHIAAITGNASRARKHFERSLKWAAQHEAKFEHAQSLAAYARWGQTFGWENADQQAVEAQQALDEIEFFRK